MITGKSNQSVSSSGQRVGERLNTTYGFNTPGFMPFKGDVDES